MDNVTMVKITSNDLYKAIKNYLHNDLGLSSKISQPYIDQLVDKAIQDRVDKMFADKFNIERIIERKIAEVVKNGENDLYRKHNKPFGQIVLDEIKLAVRDQVVNKLDIKISLDSVELKVENRDEKKC